MSIFLEKNLPFSLGTPDGIDFFESGDVLEARMMDPAKKVISELKLKINYQVFDPTKIE